MLDNIIIVIFEVLFRQFNWLVMPARLETGIHRGDYAAAQSPLRRPVQQIQRASREPD